MDKSKQYFWDVLALLGIVFIIFLCIAMSVLLGWKDSFTPARTVTISAQGMTTATPDMAEIDFSVVTQGSSPQALSDDNNTKMGAVMQFISSQGIASSDIATTGYNLQPNYQWNKDTNADIIIGYTLTQTVEVKVRDLTKVADVLGGLAPLGVNQIGNVNFTFQNPDEFVAIARADALTKAEQEAAQMAAQAGASLGSIVTVNESQYVPMPQPVYAMSAGLGAAMAQAPTPSLAPGTQDVTDTVTVTYQLK